MLVVGLVGMWVASLQDPHPSGGRGRALLAVAIPVGIWAGRNRRVEAALGPILDAMQTIPSFVYIIPVVILFTVGQVPGLIASVLYAIVPGIRITALGIKEVPSESIEASQTFGATRRQTMYGVRIPLASPTIMAGVNQVIMMVLAMVIIAGLVGGGALGFETVEALHQQLRPRFRGGPGDRGDGDRPRPPHPSLRRAVAATHIALTKSGVRLVAIVTVLPGS